MYLVATLNLALDPSADDMIMAGVIIESNLEKKPGFRESIFDKLTKLDPFKLKQQLDKAIHFFYNQRVFNNCEYVKSELRKMKASKDGSDPQNLRFYKYFIKTRFGEQAVEPCI